MTFMILHSHTLLQCYICWNIIVLMCIASNSISEWRVSFNYRNKSFSIMTRIYITFNSKLYYFQRICLYQLNISSPGFTCSNQMTEFLLPIKCKCYVTNWYWNWNGATFLNIALYCSKPTYLPCLFSVITIKTSLRRICGIGK